MLQHELEIILKHHLISLENSVSRTNLKQDIKRWLFFPHRPILAFHRYTARSSCKVDLRDYPLDDQICHLAFESCKLLRFILT